VSPRLHTTSAMPKRLALSIVLGLLATTGAVPAAGQTAPDLLLAPQASSAASRRDVPARRVRKARVNPTALDSATMRLHLFDDVQPTLKRKKVNRPSADRMVWVGDDDRGAQAVLSLVRGVLTGTVYADNRAFEISIDPDGQYSVAELDPSSFPTDDPAFDDTRFEVLNVPEALDIEAGDAVAATSDALLSGTPVQIDVMVVWTPLAETSAGGQAAMESLVAAAVENANLVYANSRVNAQLRLVYGAKVSYVENGANISADLTAVRGAGDGVLDQVHTLRTQYGADVVTLIGEGYRAAGACGIGSLMTTISTSFAGLAFNVVDRSCALGNLSYAHEVGHNQGLQHDPANAGSAPATPYAYGYQDPSGFFRTVMAYGSATRIPYVSSPANLYNGLVTGMAAQDNARALNATIGTVAAFKSAGGGTTPLPTSPTCTSSVSTTSLSFSATGGSKSVTVTAPSGCTWTTVNDAASTWVTLNTIAGSGSSSVTVTAAANTGAARSTTVTIAGTTIAVSEQAVKTRGRK
jgi:hypothetical protein